MPYIQCLGSSRDCTDGASRQANVCCPSVFFGQRENPETAMLRVSQFTHSALYASAAQLQESNGKIRKHVFQLNCKVHVSMSASVGQLTIKKLRIAIGRSSESEIVPIDYEVLNILLLGMPTVGF